MRCQRIKTSCRSFDLEESQFRGFLRDEAIWTSKSIHSSNEMIPRLSAMVTA
jgi:hypothetical protein